MACLWMPTGGIGDCVIPKQAGVVSGFTHLHSLTIPNLAGKLPNHRLSTPVNATAACDSGRGSALSIFDGGLDLQFQTTKNGDSDYDKYKFNDRTAIESPTVSEKLDEWMQKSVTEIVKNIKQAPLLVQIYADGEVKTKKALPEKSKDWKNRSSSLEGVILVEELTDPADSGDKFEDDDGIRAFGVLIQGKVKGRDQCKSTCYLLKTNSVHGGGLGHICTHFCLMKVQNFHQNAFSQFNDCWLVQ